MKQVTVPNTRGLLLLAQDAAKHRRNRQADWPKLLEAIDPSGRHLLVCRFPHEHVAGKPVEPHWRTQWMVKMDGTDTPAPLVLDVGEDVFNDVTRTMEQTWAVVA